MFVLRFLSIYVDYCSVLNVIGSKMWHDFWSASCMSWFNLLGYSDFIWILCWSLVELDYGLRILILSPDLLFTYMLGIFGGAYSHSQRLRRTDS